MCSCGVLLPTRQRRVFIFVLDVESLYLVIELLTPSGLTLRLATVDFQVSDRV
jgi:hypothetical protein